jgi:hypothetical protein
MLFYFLVGHALADYVFQSGPMAVEKSRHSKSELQQMVPWYYWLTAHALVHGGIVAVITNSLFFGIAETVLHWVIDFAKCEQWTTIHIDQLLHVLCKFLWCFWILYLPIPLQEYWNFPVRL